MSRKRLGAGKLHPFVDAMINTSKTTSEILGEHPELNSPMFEAMRVQSRAISRKVPLQEAIDKSETVALEGEDLLAAVVFYWMWALISHFSRRLAECSALLRRARSMLGKGAPPEMRGFQLEQEAKLAAVLGNMDRARELHRQVLAVVPLNSPKRSMFLAQYAQFLAPLWRLPEIEAEAAALKRLDPSGFRASMRLPRLIHFCEMCDAARLRAEIASAERDEQFKLQQTGLLFFARQLVSLLETGAVLPDTGDETGVHRNLADLLQGRPALVLEYIASHLSRDLDVYLSGNQFVAFNLVRAELARGHGQAARRVMEIRHRRGNFHPLDDFFLSRAELLEGHRDRAAQFFRGVLEVVDQHGADKRLNFELRMAGELTGADAVWLLRGSRAVATSVSAARSAVPTGRPGSEPGDEGTERLLGPSEAMVAVRGQIRQMAALDVPVLIVGETGTGKELAARALHDTGPRAGLPFVAINCGTIVDSLLESELFGHERGAFTGASSSYCGLFEQAGKGTVLLDEIGEISPRLQLALLRVLETGEFRQVGGSRPRKINCRILAATNVPLNRLMDAGCFRQDLLYRLKRLEIHMPSLRERREDILPLAEHFLGEGRVDGQRATMSSELGVALFRHDWPGNVRELRNAIERMRLLHSDKLNYDVADLEPQAATEPAESPAESERSRAPARRAGPQSTVRRLALVRKLFRSGEPQTGSEIAHFLGVSRNTVTAYLRILREEGLIEKVEPKRSPRTHYFRLKQRE